MSIFMMATTELSKIPDTVLSRSQVFEFKTISSRRSPISSQDRGRGKMTVEDAALALIARAADGSMRDAQSALRPGDRVRRADGVSRRRRHRARAGRPRPAARHRHRVADETPAAAFDLSGRAVELGYDLRSVVRELARVVRDLMVLSVDPVAHRRSRYRAESERER